MSETSLSQMWSDVPDPRSPRGQRRPLPAVLNLTVLAILAGMKSLLAIARFGRDHGPDLAIALGFKRARFPTKSALARIFRVETRTLRSTTLLNDYLDWPGVGQVFELERVRRFSDGTEQFEVVHAICSLSREEANAELLLELTRDHWGIENSSHHVRDETFGEDRCRVRTGEGPQVLAAMRNVAIYLLEEVDAVSKAAACRRLAIHPEEGIALIS